MIKLNYIEDIDFRKIMEALKRIGVTKKEQRNIVFQVSYLLKINHECYLAHYKEINNDELTDLDKQRLNCIANQLEKWSLCSITEESKIQIQNEGALETIFIVSKERMKNDGWKTFSVITINKLKNFINNKKNKEI